MMNKVLEYKGYYTKVEYSVPDKVFHGRIEGINDLVNFEVETAAEVEEKFKEAVDDYLALCEDIKQNPEKTYGGVFNVRISPELHKKAIIESMEEGITLNQFVGNAIAMQLELTEKHQKAN